MHFTTIAAFLLPLARAATWNLSGTCASDNTCAIDKQYTDPGLATICGSTNGKANGNFDGDGNGGKTWCSPGQKWVEESRDVIRLPQWNL
ncbi:hypothetical protein Cob_v007807 [Colletotrichum orbiculare MAFF 240422]|uniref:Uncharacterized protein n=1 Tax=Colletotrichum orbiculare (strain 104-T / ATCC 96160 / CBS 514.97 / LARS 414 / MAFF 240422) TaxID=1213857 RepID=A0A484FNS5_COLOR|nr:hypothetical protein Cob_v007807 [Colletotrichum orbiculare MAFF 240422]